jgi:hypothetical protein
MSGILSASMTVRRREEAFLVRARMDRIDAQLGQLLAEVGASPSSPPAFTDADVEEVGRILVEGRIKLPTHARLTVTTTIEEVRHKLFNTTTEVITHTADQLHTHLLRPMTVLEALEAGLIRRIPAGWVWSEAAYERLSNAR